MRKVLLLTLSLLAFGISEGSPVLLENKKSSGITVNVYSTGGRSNSVVNLQANGSNYVLNIPTPASETPVVSVNRAKDHGITYSYEYLGIFPVGQTSTTIYTNSLDLILSTSQSLALPHYSFTVNAREPVTLEFPNSVRYPIPAGETSITLTPDSSTLSGFKDDNSAPGDIYESDAAYDSSGGFGSKQVNIKYRNTTVKTFGITATNYIPFVTRRDTLIEDDQFTEEKNFQYLGRITNSFRFALGSFTLSPNTVATELGSGTGWDAVEFSHKTNLVTQYDFDPDTCINPALVSLYNQREVTNSSKILFYDFTQPDTTNTITLWAAGGLGTNAIRWTPERVMNLHDEYPLYITTDKIGESGGWAVVSPAVTSNAYYNDPSAYTLGFDTVTNSAGILIDTFKYSNDVYEVAHIMKTTEEPVIGLTKGLPIIEKTYNSVSFSFNIPSNTLEEGKTYGYKIHYANKAHTGVFNQWGDNRSSQAALQTGYNPVDDNHISGTAVYNGKAVGNDIAIARFPPIIGTTNEATFTFYLKKAIRLCITGVEFLDIDDRKQVFSKQDYVDGVYERNTNCWLYGPEFDLTPFSPWHKFEDTRRAGALITRKHLVSAAHFILDYTAATSGEIGGDKSWHSPTNDPGRAIRFIKDNGEIVERYLVRSRRVDSGSDLRVYMLNEEVPEGIGICKVLPKDYLKWNFSGNQGVLGAAFTKREDVHPVLFTGGHRGRFTGVWNGRFRPESYICDIIGDINKEFQTRPDFWSNAIPDNVQAVGDSGVSPTPIKFENGDSGNPLFMFFEGDPSPVLIATFYFPGSGPSLWENIDSINRTIEWLSGDDTYSLTEIDLDSLFGDRGFYNRDTTWATNYYNTHLSKPYNPTYALPGWDYGE